MNKKNIFLIIFALWLFIILAFIGYKQYTLSSGEMVLLKTQPVDPRDWVRGDYVILSYEISRLPSDINTVENISRGNSVYVLLEPDKNDSKYHTAKEITPAAPEEGLFIKADVLSTGANSIRLKYGIESYFVPEGEGKEIEKYRGGELDIEVAVDQFGNAIINQLLVNDTPIVFE